MYQTLISVTEARNLTGDVIFVDCRHQLGNPAFGPEQYRLGHLPRARFAHLDHDLSSPVISGRTGRHPLPDPETLRAFFGTLGIGPDTQVVAYDQDIGMFAARLWWLLRAFGHKAVSVLDGGYAAWVAAGGELDQDFPPPAEGRFEGHWRPHCVDSRDVLDHLGHADRVLIDARLPERFQGLVEPIDPKAGHIPGAVNLPFTRHCEQGFWLGREALKARYAAYANRDMVCYCGSGVTACHSILAVVHAGLPEPRLYAGSWSEWITEDSRPVATGA